MVAYSLEQELFQRKNRALDLIQQGQAFDPLTVSRMLRIANTWPQMRPGAALSFAASGFDQNSPETRAAAQLATKQAALQSQWTAHLVTQPDKPRQTAQHNPSLADIPTEKLFALRQQLSRDQGRALDGKLSTKAFQRRWGHDPEDGNAQKRMMDAFSYELGQRDQSQVKDLFGKNYAEFHSILGRINEESSIAQDMKSINSSLPVQALKFATRETGAIANAGLQYVQGMIRNEAGGGTILASSSGQPTSDQTDLGQQINALAHGNDASLGNGFLPSPESAPARAALDVQRQAAPTIGGHAFTLGRAVANQVFEPDTPGFNVLSGVVDAGIAIKADPAAAVLGTIGDVRQANQLFEPDTRALVNEMSTATGLTPTTSRLTLNQTTKAQWLAGQDSTDTAQALMDIAQGSPSRMMRAINNANLRSPDFPITTVHGQPLISELADSKTVDEFKNALARATEATTIPSAPGVTYHLRQGLDSRLLAGMPYGTFDPADKNYGWKVIDDIMRGANVPMDVRDQVLDKYIRDPRPLAGLDAASEAISAHLVHNYGIDENKARTLSTFFNEANRSQRAHDIDQLTGVERVRPGIGIAGDGYPIPAPSLSSEGLNSLVSVPNMRELRRAASDFNFITAKAPWRVTQTALALPSTAWKSLQVLTARMAVRIFGESQLNMAGRGMVNAFTDPKDFISMLMGTHNDSMWSNYLDKIPGLNKSFIVDAEGRNILDHTENLLMHSASFIHDPETIVTKGYMVVPITHPDAGYGFAEQLGRMHADPIMRGIAEQTDPLAAKEWFWSGEGKALRLERAKITANEDAWNAEKLAGGKLTGYDPIGDIANDRAASDRYLDEVMYPRLTDYTKGHPDLLEAVQTGKLNGRVIYNVSGGRKDLGIVDERAAKYARDLLGQGFGPQRGVPIREVIPRGATDLAQSGALARRAVDTAFHFLVDAPDRLLNRSPAFAQLRWSNVEDLAPYLRSEDLPKLIDNAERANLPREQLSRIRNIALDNTSTQRLTLGQLNTLAKANALDDARNIVHDLTTRSQFFDMTRFLMPFGDAFRLIASRMVHLAAEEPQVVRRVQQGIQELQSPGSASINRALGDPVNPNDGFFHTDPATGQEVFTFPGSSIITNQLIGVPVPLQGQVSGLNMIGEGYPGFGGPMISLPAKWFLPDTPTGDKIKEVLFPYGGGDSLGLAADVGGQFVPPWLMKIAQGPTDQKTFNSSVAAVMRTLASSGDYNLSDPKELSRLADDAKEDARLLYIIRGAAQFVSPGAPTPDYLIHDKTGHLADMQVAIDAYNKVKEKDGPDKAFQWLIDNLGTKNMFVAQAASAPNSYAAPTTKAAQEWADAHPDAVKKFPLTYGLFAPTSKDRSFSIDAYNKQFDKGERRSLSADEQIAQAENRMGFFMYDRKRAEIIKKNRGQSLDQPQQAWLRRYRQYLQEQFPGFDSYLASPYDSQKRRNSAIQELQAAAKDDQLVNTDAGQGLKAYLTYREQAYGSAKRAGLASPFQAKKARPLRTWLRDVADALIADHPDFRPMWEQIFSHEFTTEAS